MTKYIDADALLSKYGEKHFNGEITSEEYYAIKIPLDYAPTADVVERKRGEWKVSNLPKGRKLKYCSECGFGQNMNDDRIYNYCPNCGAEMDERREDDL